MEEKKEYKAKISKIEIVITTILGLIGLAGLVFIILGFISSYLPALPENNWTNETAFKDVMKMSYRLFGAILLVGAAILGTFFLNFFARKSDVDSERASRRAQRLKILSSNEEENKVVEVASIEAKEK